MSMALATVPSDETSLKLYSSSALGSLNVSQYRPQITNENRPRHKFFNALAPASPITKNGVYLTLQKRMRGRIAQAQLYIGRVVQRDRRKGETSREWTVLSMTQAESFVVDKMRRTRAEDGEDWLKWTERYYALKGKRLPLIPDGVEGSAWEVDADGKYVQQLMGGVSDEGSTLVPVIEGWDDMESWTPPSRR